MGHWGGWHKSSVCLCVCVWSSWGLSHIPLGDGTITRQLMAAVQTRESYLDALPLNQLTCGPSHLNVCLSGGLGLRSGQCRKLAFGATLGNNSLSAFKGHYRRFCIYTLHVICIHCGVLFNFVSESKPSFVHEGCFRSQLCQHKTKENIKRTSNTKLAVGKKKKEDKENELA